eukprot:scaffold2.g7090.t1
MDPARSRPQAGPSLSPPQPMKLSHFPFDQFDLLMALEFLDTARPPHPGVTVHASSAGTALYTFGRGDDVSDWRVQGITLSVQGVNTVSVFQSTTTRPSSPGDPLPLGDGRAAVLRSSLPGTSSAAGGRPVRMLFVKLRVARYWQYHLVTAIVPLLLLAWVSFIVLFLPRRDLAARLGVIVTLFLALAAMQARVRCRAPTPASRMRRSPVVVTYCLLALMAVESIVVYYVESYKAKAEERRMWREARRRYRALWTARTEAADADAPAADLAGGSPAAGLPPTPPAGEADKGGGVGGGSPLTGGASSEGKLAAGQAGAHLTRLQSLSEDATLDAWAAWALDRTVLGVLCLLYNLSVVLIYTLQQVGGKGVELCVGGEGQRDAGWGYIDLFEGINGASEG